MGPTRGGHRAAVAGAVAAGVLLAGCTPGESGNSAGRPPSPPISSSPAATGRPEATPSTTPAALPPVADPVSLPAMMRKEYDGRALRLGRVLARTESYTRRAVTYRSGTLRISGIMNIPAGSGPHPVLVLLHGYIDPDVYVSGQGLMREQDYLARRGYAVLHTDYRGHAGSDDDPRAELDLRLGYTEDAINAVLAVRRSSLAALDGDRVGLLGRSMGGGVTYNVLTARPGLVAAAVVFAPVSSRAEDNFDRWIRSDRPALAAGILARHGSPERNRGFWAGVSPRTYFDRVTEPVLIHHGTSDDSCPIRWSRATYAELRRQGKDVRLAVYPGEEHAFGPLWPLSMRRTVAYLDRRLGVER